METGRSGSGASAPPTVGLLSWGNVIEDFLDPSGLTLTRFVEEFTGSWLFGWARALQHAGVRTVVVLVSRDVRAPVRTTHRPTGTPLLVLPATRAYRAFSRRMTYPYADTAQGVFKWTTPPSVPRRLLAEVARELAPYTATPVVHLARAVRRERWRAVVCQEYESPRFDVAVSAGCALGVPVFACFQGGRHQLGRLEALLRPLAIARSAGLVVAPDREVIRVTQRYGVASAALARIPNPVDTDVFRPRDRGSARHELGLPAGVAVVVWHGRMAMHHKGLDVLLDAWARLTAEHDGDVRLLLIGGGQDATEVERRVAEGGLRGVHRVERHVDDPTALSRYLSCADVAVFASRHEGFAVAPLEAMACGLPLVATDVAGIRELLPEGERSGGLVVPVGDVAALAGALGELLLSEERRIAAGARARTRAEDAFSLSVVGARLRALLVDSAGPGRTGNSRQPFRRRSERGWLNCSRR